MHGLRPAVMSWLSTHHGVITMADLLALGATIEQLRRLRRMGILVPYVPGVYRLAAAPRTTAQAAALACASSPDVVVSHVSAGRAWKLRRLGADDRLHVLISGAANRRIGGVVLHRCHRIDPVDVVERSDGIRLTSPPRTVFDLAAGLNDERLESIIEQVVHDELATIATLIATGKRLRQRGRRGSARFGRVLQSRPQWLKPLDSDLELLVERAIVAAGLPRPLRQHPTRLHTGELIHPDYFWPVERVVLEIDHVTWHGGKLDLTADKRRDRLLARLGIRSVRVTDIDARQRLPAVIDDLRVILERTGERGAS